MPTDNMGNSGRQQGVFRHKMTVGDFSDPEGFTFPTLLLLLIKRRCGMLLLSNGLFTQNLGRLAIRQTRMQRGWQKGEGGMGVRWRGWEGLR